MLFFIILVKFYAKYLLGEKFLIIFVSEFAKSLFF